MAHHLAQINVAAAVAPLDDPRMAGFVDGLVSVNALAEGSPGFVWRLQDDAGDATGIQAFDDPTILVNITVWESVEALRDFTYRSEHGAYFRRRREWFAADRRGTALWWVEAGHIPSVDEAVGRLEYLRAHGPSPFAFTFATVVPPPGQT